MKILFITHYSSLYGSNRSLLNLIDGLKEFNVVSFVLLCSGGEMTAELEKRKIPFYIFPFKQWMNQESRFFKLKAVARLLTNLAATPIIVNKIKQWKPDIIYSNSSVTPIGIFLAFALRRPHIWHIREFGWLDYNLKHDLGMKFFRYLVNKSDAIIAVSKSIKRVVLSGADAKTHVIYNGVVFKKDAFTLKERLPPFNSDYIFSIVGLITKNKGQEQAIRALADLKNRYPNVKLFIAGSGEENYLTQLVELCKNLNIDDRVKFLGYVLNPFEVYLKSQAVLMCSSNEGMGRVTAEAMATTRPVIGYNNAGTAEIIENELTGLLYSGDYKDLSCCMERFIKNPKWAQKLGLNGWERAQKKYTVEIYAERVYDVLKEVADANNKSF